MIDKMPLVNIKHNKKIFLGRKIYCAQNLAKSEFLNLTFILGKFLNIFQTCPKFVREFFPRISRSKNFCPTHFTGGVRDVIVPTRTERKNAQTSKISSQWCLIWRKISGSKLRLFWFLDGTLPRAQIFSWKI